MADGLGWTYTYQSGIITTRATVGYIARRDIQRNGSSIEFCLIRVKRTFGDDMGSITPLHRFTATITRAEYLIDLQAALETAPPAQKARRSDVVRAAVVLSVAAMDAYFTDKYCTILIPYIKKYGATPRIKQRLTSAGLDVEQSLQMALMARPHARVLSLARRHLSRKTMQSRKAIDNLYEDYGIDGFVAAVEAATGRKTLFRRIEMLIERRHKIVHAGDLNAKNRANAVNNKDLIARISDVKVLVYRADHLLYERLGRVGA